MKFSPWRDFDTPLFEVQCELEEQPRAFSVWKWDGRLAFQDRDRPALWWATQNELAQEEDPRAFWHGEVEARRVCRALAVERGFEVAPRSNGARLVLHASEFDVFAREDNSGMARGVTTGNQLLFAPKAPHRKVARPLAVKPSILSPRWNTSHVRRALGAIGDELARQKVETLPPMLRNVWEEGAASCPMALVRAALGMGWTPPHFLMTAELFWRGALERAAGKAGMPLPRALLDSEELATGGHLSLSRFAPARDNPAVWRWHQKGITLSCRLAITFESHHEQVEARLELRDFLARFFPARRVEEWLR
jgi:hypothetical protein